jgi:hypothetical protein
MTAEFRCFRCGESLAGLTPPFSRRDECPSCSVHLHVCRMCEYFDATVPRQCREDDAEEVLEKERVNFCEWFKPSPEAFDPKRARIAAEAQSALAVLFGETDGEGPGGDDPLREAEDLFR